MVIGRFTENFLEFKVYKLFFLKLCEINETENILNEFKYKGFDSI
jgi:hypothetical protein